MERTVDTSLAQEIFMRTLDEASTGREAAEQARERAEELRETQEAFRAQVGWAMETKDVPPNFEMQVDLETEAEALEEAADTVGEVVGSTKVDDLEANVAGQAKLGQEGSEVIDVRAAMKEGDVFTIDAQMLQDTVDHEYEHTLQAKTWDATAVDIGEEKPLTEREITETGAMSVQDNIDWVSDEYKGIFKRVTGLVSAERAKEVARTGNLEELGREIREKKGLPAEEPEYQTAA